MKRAQILNNRVHFIFNAEDYPDPPWPNDQDGNPVILIDLVGDNENAQEGDGYDGETGKVVQRVQEDENDTKDNYSRGK
jgi:hypothetical protein